MGSRSRQIGARRGAALALGAAIVAEAEDAPVPS